MPSSNLKRDPVDTLKGEYTGDLRNQVVGSYRVGTLQYPDDLRSPNREDLQHYVAFFINVREKSKKFRDTDQFSQYKVSEDEQRRLDILRNAYGRRDTQASATDAINNLTANKEALPRLAAGITAVVDVATSSNFRSAITGLPLTAAKAGLAYVGTSFIQSSIKDLASKEGGRVPFADGKTKRLQDVITLHLEERPSVKYGVNYTDTDLSALTGIFLEGSAAYASNSLEQANPEIRARVLAELAKMPAFLTGGTSAIAGGFINQLREIYTKTKTNPFRETFFESVDYRSFVFRYKFFPKNLKESQSVQNIIKTFKIHMFPELTSNRMFYVYPSEFDIEYYYKDDRNPYLHKFTRCVLTDMNIDYGGEQYATFSDGAPVEISMSLTFREIEQLNSEMVENGY